MSSANEFINLINCTISFSAPEGEFEGLVRQVIPTAEIIVVGKLTLLPDCRLGSLNFRFSELANIRVINQPDRVKEISPEKNDSLPVYPKTEIEKLFDFDEGSDIEDVDCVDNLQEAYKVKWAPHLSKLVPKDFEIIDSFNQDFSLAIKHIRQQEAIGVSLEGFEVSRSGKLTWICISTPFCNFLFDILVLGVQSFEKGLKSILENGSIQKIIHDCRLASDCLYHKYGVRLVNVFDTQVADFIFMMQMIQKEKINNRVNTLDACLNYYLEVPCEYLYGDANFDNCTDSLNFYASRPLRHEIQDVLIKNVMYLHLLKRELDVALLTPLRRATNVYLNSVQKLKESELLVVPHKPDELPLDMHLEGIQIFRYKDFEHACSTVASGPPYREIANPIKSYLNYRAECKNSQKKDKQSILNNSSSQNVKVTSSELNFKARVNSLGKSSESDQECSDDSEKNQSANCSEEKEHTFNSNPSLRAGNDSNISVRQKSIVKSETSKFSESSTVRNPVICDHSSNTDDLSSFKYSCNPPVSNTVSKSETLQLRRPTLGRKSPKELLELISRMKSSNSLTADTSDENLANDSITTSESVCEKTRREGPKVVKNSSNVQFAQINDPVVKKDESLSDSDLEDIAARVRARGALLRNRKTAYSASDCLSTSDAFNRMAELKPNKKTGAISLGNVEPTSEDVTIYYSDRLDKPSQFVVKVNHKSSRLADLYKKAGDRYLLWSEENSDSEPKSSLNSESTDNDNVWASVLGDLPRGPIDEKLRSRLVPAGMSGY